MAQNFIKLSRSLFSTRITLKHQIPNAVPIKGHKGAPKLPRKGGLAEKQNITNVKHVIAVASGKGGVGKSTTAVNLAMAASQLNLKVGILDTDIFGPSIPKLMNLTGQPELTENGSMIPLQNYGVPCMSMGFLVDPDQAIVWRGMMVMKALQQLLYQVSWPQLDLLILDMPPGTGDVQLTVGQLVPLSGAVIVSTPQDIALIDVRKGVDLFQKLSVKILGVVQNMSHFNCPKCNHSSHLFGHDGAAKLATQLNVPHLADLPLTPEICDLSDRGTPIVVTKPNGSEAEIYRSAAAQIATQLNLDFTPFSR